jgi:hypothetical protein
MTKWVIPDTPSPEALVKAALERAAAMIGTKAGHNGAIPDCNCGSCFARRRDHAEINAVASDPAAVAQIIEQAKGKADDRSE